MQKIKYKRGSKWRTVPSQHPESGIKNMFGK